MRSMLCALLLAPLALAAQAPAEALFNLVQLNAQAERDVLGRADGTGLCPAHLYDACSALADGPGPLNAAAQLLALEAERSIVWLAETASPASLRSALRMFADRRRGSRDGGVPDECAACQAAEAATGRMLETLRHTPAVHAPALCLRHVMSLRQQDPRGADGAVRVASRRTESVLRELEEAFRKRSWAHRHEPRGSEMTAWRRAAALIDGRVYGGGPPGPL